MNNTNFNWNIDLLNFVTVMSYLISIENLQLNMKKTSTDELNRHLEEQDKILKSQNDDYLETIIKQNEEIILLLKGGAYES